MSAAHTSHGLSGENSLQLKGAGRFVQTVEPVCDTTLAGRESLGRDCGSQKASSGEVWEAHRRWWLCPWGHFPHPTPTPLQKVVLKHTVFFFFFLRLQCLALKGLLCQHKSYCPCVPHSPPPLWGFHCLGRLRVRTDAKPATQDIQLVLQVYSRKTTAFIV